MSELRDRIAAVFPDHMSSVLLGMMPTQTPPQNGAKRKRVSSQWVQYYEPAIKTCQSAMCEADIVAKFQRAVLPFILSVSLSYVHNGMNELCNTCGTAAKAFTDFFEGKPAQGGNNRAECAQSKRQPLLHFRVLLRIRTQCVPEFLPALPDALDNSFLASFKLLLIIPLRSQKRA